MNWNIQVLIIDKSFSGKILYEWLELELYRVASQFGRHELSIAQFDNSLSQISKKCSIVLKCFGPIENPSVFEEMIIKSTNGMKLSTKRVRKSLSGHGARF